MDDDDQAPDPMAAQPAGRYPGHGDPLEWERLVHALGVRFAPHLEAAAGAVREAEDELSAARDNLARARKAEEDQRYQSDRLVFMRASLADEVEALGRKSTPKKLRVAYRYLVSRAAELAQGEVQGYLADQAAQRRHREESVAACMEAERRASDRLDAAAAMQQRVLAAERTALQGLAVLSEKLAGQGDSLASV